MSGTLGAKELHLATLRRMALTPTPLPMRGRGASRTGCARQNRRGIASFWHADTPSSPLSRAPGEGLGVRASGRTAVSVGDV
jgi:hypothetical protein